MLSLGSKAAARLCREHPRSGGRRRRRRHRAADAPISARRSGRRSPSSRPTSRMCAAQPRSPPASCRNCLHDARDAPHDQRPADPVALAQALIRCESVTPDEGGALTLLQDVLERCRLRLPSHDVLRARHARRREPLCAHRLRAARTSASPATPTSCRRATRPPGPCRRSPPRSATACSTAAAPST